MNAIAQALAGLTLGAPQNHKNLAIFPLIGEDDPAGKYMLLDEALQNGLAEVTEVSQGGHVPNLAFENKSDMPILLVEGDELRGAKQNRILNLTIFVGVGIKMEIPVSCVEKGRWNYNSAKFASGTQNGGGSFFAKGRAANYSNVTASLRAGNSAAGDQGKVWADVDRKLENTSTYSHTSSMSDAYTVHSVDIEKYEDAFSYEPRQRGAVVCVDGKPVGMELFDSTDAFRKFLTKLVRSYALDAIETGGDSPLPKVFEVESFLESVKNVQPEGFSTVGEGMSLRWANKTVTGGARVVAGKAVHVASFTTQ